MPTKENKLLEAVFYSNCFYGICAVALSIEAGWQQQVAMNGFGYYANVFLATVVFYCFPYIKKGSTITYNPRTNWYSKNFNLLYWIRKGICLILLFSAVLFLAEHGKKLLHLNAGGWMLLLSFPIAGCLYYGTGFLSGKYNLRNIGWLKPFLIGFTWAGIVTIYPVLFYDMLNGQTYQLNWIPGLLFIKNLVFVSILCIMFDIKDYAADCVARLRTFAVEIGLRKTIFHILLPLTIAGLVGFIYYAEAHQFQQLKLVLNIIPFILAGLVAWSLRRRRSLLYYLCIVDGLMLVKAICGCIAIKYS